MAFGYSLSNFLAVLAIGIKFNDFSPLFFAWQGDERYFTLNTAITEIFLRLSEWILPPAVSLEVFLEFIESALLGKV